MMITFNLSLDNLAARNRAMPPAGSASFSGHKPAARCRTALGLATFLCGSLLSPSALADFTGSFPVGVNGCDNSATDQLCTPIPAVALPTDGVLKVDFTASTEHCSNIIAHILVDGVERFTSGALIPGASIGLQNLGPVAAGVHTVGVQAEGIVGGCNTGSLAIWEGDLALTVSGITDAQSAVVYPGDNITLSTLIDGPDPRPAAVSASYSRATSALGLSTLSVANFPPGPVIPNDPVLPVGSVAFLDLFLLGGSADDSLQAVFYPPHPIFPPDPIQPSDPLTPTDPIRLAYWDSTDWAAVLDSTAQPILLNDLNQFTVNLTATSTPRITQLNGTVFAIVAAFGMVGFEEPVDNDTLNIANAGRAVPLKFKLYDLGGNPVTNLTQAYLSSVPLACDSVSAAADVVETYANAASGLQNFGDGSYQINWGTSKSYANSCRRLRLDLGERNPDGTPFYRTADFRFK
jgi:hypothetical protein